ncbi:MAG: hypothetical protein WD021_01275 [Rhodothermales bacterium]
MSYPTPGAYQEAVQFPESAFTDPILREAEPEETVLGLPRAITGAFAVVFPLVSRGARWAVKCFVTDVRDQESRYRAVAEHLLAVDLSYTVPFDYQEGGIEVEGERYPILKMEWIEAEALNAYVARHRDDEGAMDDLIARWRRMVQALEEAEIAHGDLQHGNVLVEDDGGLRLVDYDTMLVPALWGRKSPEVGHRNYQHPDRDEHHSGPYLDRFAALVVDTGLRAVAARPDLWERYDTGENLLFRSSDLIDPDGSALFEELHRIDALADQVDALRRACYLPPEQIPPLELVVSNVDVVPDAHRRETVPREEKDAFERFIYPISAAILAVVALTQVVDSVAIALLVAVVGVAGVGLWGWTRYRKLPFVHRARRLAREDAYFQQLLGSLRDEVQRLEKRRRETLDSHASRREERLDELRDEALNEKLKYHFIDEAGEFDGITHKVIVRLKASGIRTAEHATPGEVGAIVQMSDASKTRVNLWRAGLVSQYRDEVPDALSPAEERRLQRSLDRELEQVDAELARMRKQISLQEEEHAEIAERRSELDVPSYAEFLSEWLRPSSWTR